MGWEKLISSGSNVNLQSLSLLGADSTTETTISSSQEVNPDYLPNDQLLHLHDFTDGSDGVDDNFWKTNNANSNATSGSWTSKYRFVFDDFGTLSIHRKFEVIGSSTGETGPNDGISIDQTQVPTRTLPQTEGAPFLYTDVSVGATTHNLRSITSPFLNLTDYTSKKLVFYFHLYGANCGNFQVWTSTSATHLYGGYQMDMKYSNWPGPGSPNQTENVDYFSGGSENTPTSVLQIPPSDGQIQASKTSRFNRVEVDLAPWSLNPQEVNKNLNEGYIWIIYNPATNSFGNLLGELAINHLFLDLDGYEVVEFNTINTTVETEIYEPSLEVLGEAIKLYGLPEENPEEKGALYKEPPSLANNPSYILISTGSAG